MQDRRPESSGREIRLPAIAPRQTDGPSLGSHAALGDAATEPRRNKLPPRSRSGCWTCRTRKVKCDEQRPACGQCVRLGHQCDYNPRLSFRDDTSRIVERMQEVSVIGSSVWGSHHENTGLRHTRSVEDVLPPFHSLTNDEEREKKAELHQPGTYHVIANPRTFESLPEYRAVNLPHPDSLYFGQHPDDESLDSADRENPNVVILRTFEDTPRRASVQTTYKHIPQRLSPSLESHSARRQSTDIHQVAPLLAERGGRDEILLQHYLRTISPQVLRRELLEGEEDIFIVQSRSYPPLSHAIMALAQLTLAGAQTPDSLEHYQQVIPALQTIVRSSQDSFSDGALFTHFILLLYEITAALHGASNMAQHHGNQLLRIVRLRRQVNNVEPFGFIVWTVASIDIAGLLTMSGTGEFIENLVEENLIPPAEFCLPPSTEGQAQLSPNLNQQYASAMKSHQEALLLAFRVGQQARNFRTEATHRQDLASNTAISDSTAQDGRQDRIQNLLNFTHQSYASWTAQVPFLQSSPNGSDSLPPQVSYCVLRTYLLYRVCVIYVRTSMFPGQQADLLPGSREITTFATEIIEGAQSIVAQRRLEVRSVIFSLFMAGFATHNPVEKQTVLDLLLVIETRHYRGSTESTRSLLQKLYGMQEIAAKEFGHTGSVDWIDVMQRTGQRFIV